MGLVLLFLSGALLCNAIPHLTSGLSGDPFPSPFATPRGVGDSSPLVNFLWGSANLFLGAGLMIAWLPASGFMAGLAAAAIGWLALGLYLSLHFGKVRRHRQSVIKHPE
ncbi:hypothetical protein NDN01_14600 [Sphingomonas sp. QA11]|uniref:hypothetical protein n=1 Tax=Sphingomonas sp. QA11 TaxID=2950605 RepID=UPI00234981B1|nr:hypothetical protein [Sphingomonas sp. QA11]WCM25294.1 hypothetical protein NDN01_14600 [Sphingomonas sp. QA11]